MKLTCWFIAKTFDLFLITTTPLPPTAPLLRASTRVVAMAPPVSPWSNTATSPSLHNMPSRACAPPTTASCPHLVRCGHRCGLRGPGADRPRRPGRAGPKPAALDQQEHSNDTSKVMQCATVLGLPAASRSDRHFRQQQATLARQRTANAMSDTLGSAPARRAGGAGGQPCVRQRAYGHRGSCH